jgi:hypothetical protein
VDERSSPGSGARGWLGIEGALLDEPGAAHRDDALEVESPLPREQERFLAALR